MKDSFCLLPSNSRENSEPVTPPPLKTCRGKSPLLCPWYSDPETGGGKQSPTASGNIGPGGRLQLSRKEFVKALAEEVGEVLLYCVPEDAE